MSQVNINTNIDKPSHILSQPNMISYGQLVDCGGEPLWSEDFSSGIPQNMSMEDNGFGGWNVSTIGSQGQWSSPNLIVESPTNANGFMLIDADFYNSYPQNNVDEGIVGENGINASFTIGPLNFESSSTDELTLEFYSLYRICCTAAGAGGNDLNIFISTDGGTTFEDLNYIEGDIYETNTAKQVLSQIPLKDFSANTNNVYFKFEWIGTHYFWMIDDISVSQRPNYDLQMKSAWISMENPANIEYHTIPMSQMPEEMLIGAEVYNFGYENEEEVTLLGAIEGTNINASGTVSINSDSTTYIETNYFDVTSLYPGTYIATANISSTNNDCNTSNNYKERWFNVSENLYSLGGFYENYKRWGTGWPEGDENADGVRYANFFDIKETATLSSIGIDLFLDEVSTSLGDFQTTFGGEIIAYICDTTGILDPNVTELDMDLGGILYESEFYLVTEDDVNNGAVIIDNFLEEEIILEPGAYYVVVELYSNGLDNDILIYDDHTVPQPWYASLYYSVPNDTWYSNPNAAGISIGLDGLNVGLDKETINNFKVYPNPSLDYINIVLDEVTESRKELRIYNVLGEIVKQQKINNFKNELKVDITKLKPGSYFIELKDDNHIQHQKLTVQ